MATFTLRERLGTVVDIPDPNVNPPDTPEATVLAVDRLLEDTHGNLRGSFTFCGVVTKKFVADDLEVAFDATNKLDKGVINTQGVIRFADFASTNGVTWAPAFHLPGPVSGRWLPSFRRRSTALIHL
jgi:hypothetical protein